MVYTGQCRMLGNEVFNVCTFLKGLEVGTVAPEAQDCTCASVYVFTREEARSSNLFVFNSSVDAG